MVVDWLRKLQQHLEQPMYIRCRPKVEPTDHMRDALSGVVNHNGQMIAG